MQTLPKYRRGFTLLEMIVVIVITGIIGGMVAIFLRAPVQGYVDSARRAEMTDIADTAMRRFARDLRTAVPNSVRISAADDSYIEFLPTRDGGRYRVTDVGAGGCGAGNELSFSAADTCFEIIGAPMNFVTGDAIVVGSTQSDGSLPYKPVADATSVRRLVSAPGAGVGITTVRIDSTVPFPASSELEGHRFEVVPVDQKAVTYACIGMQGGALDANGDGQGSLTRFWGYGYNDPQAAPATLAVVSSTAILAGKVSDCHFVYDTGNQRNSLVAVRFRITRGGESVNLYREVHVNNIP